MPQKKVGLHLRVTDSLTATMQKALDWQLPFFQLFVVDKSTGKLLNFKSDDVVRFAQGARDHFLQLYLHGSYWINLAGIKYTGHRSLYRETRFAQTLGFTHIILHPGSAKGAHNKREGIEACARSLNDFFKKDTAFHIVLENTAYGGMSIGGDIIDLKEIRALLDAPERVSFCIDTAHAHSYGYDIITPQGQKNFMQILDNELGRDAISLIHLNDTVEEFGSKIDRHAVPGAGLIGLSALESFVAHPFVSGIPVLLELPVISEQQEYEMIQMVRKWV